MNDYTKHEFHIAGDDMMKFLFFLFYLAGR